MREYDPENEAEEGGNSSEEYRGDGVRGREGWKVCKLI
jgi:hypothetical protein